MPPVAECSEIHTTLIEFSGSEWIVLTGTTNCKQSQVMLLVAESSEIYTTLIGFSGSEWIVLTGTTKQSQVMLLVASEMHIKYSDRV